MLKQHDVIQTLQERSEKYSQRRAQVGLISGVIADAKEFFTKLGSSLADRVTSKTIKVDVQNQIKLPDVQKVDGSVSLKDARALVAGLEEVRKAVAELKSLEQAITKLSTDLKPESVDFSTLERAVREIEIPETIIPEYPKSVTVDNLSEVKKALQSVEKAVQSITIPEVKIPKFPTSIAVSNFPEPEEKPEPKLLSFYWTNDKYGNLENLVEVYDTGEVVSTGFNLGRVKIDDRRS